MYAVSAEGFGLIAGTLAYSRREAIERWLNALSSSKASSCGNAERPNSSHNHQGEPKMAKIGKLELKGTSAIRSILRAVRDGNKKRSDRYYLVSPYEMKQIDTFLKAADAEAQLYRNTALEAAGHSR